MTTLRAPKNAITDLKTGLVTPEWLFWLQGVADASEGLVEAPPSRPPTATPPPGTPTPPPDTTPPDITPPDPTPPGGGGLTGTGIPGHLAVWSAPSALADSQLSVSGGRLTGGGTGVGFTIDFNQSTVVGTVPRLNLPPTIAYTDVQNVFSAAVGPQQFMGNVTTGDAIKIRGRASDHLSTIAFYGMGGGTQFGVISNTTTDLVLTHPTNVQLIPQTLYLRPTGGNCFPFPGYFVNLGHITNKFLTLHCAELWVETLVAQETLATIGGRILVGPTTTLTRDVLPGDTTITVKHGFFQLYVAGVETGSKLVLESAGKFEVMFVTNTTAPAANADGSFTYSVSRNLDGSGANNWYAGDAVFDTGKFSNGFIDLYSLRGVASASRPTVQYGPTIVGMVRIADGWPGIRERWAIGNLNGVYYYGVDIYGVAFGNPDATHITIDASNGFRIRYNTTPGAPTPTIVDTFYADTGGNLWLKGNLTIGPAGIFRTETATDINTGTGIYMAGGTTPVFRVGEVAATVGNPAKSIRWDGNNLRVGFFKITTTDFSAVTGVSDTPTGLNLNAQGLIVLGTGSASDIWMSMVDANSNRIWVGGAGSTTAPFRVDHVGNVTAASLYTPGRVNIGTGGSYFSNDLPGQGSIALTLDSSATWAFRGSTAGFTGVLPAPTLTQYLGHPSFQFLTIYCQNVVQSSDVRFKRDLAPADLGLAFLERVPVQSFRYLTDDTLRIGFTTQAVEAALEGRPFAALHKHAEGDGLDYGGFVPVLTNAVQELARRVRVLEARE
jgi:hypothetical protein